MGGKPAPKGATETASTPVTSHSMVVLWPSTITSGTATNFLTRGTAWTVGDDKIDVGDGSGVEVGEGMAGDVGVAVGVVTTAAKGRGVGVFPLAIELRTSPPQRRPAPSTRAATISQARGHFEATFERTDGCSGARIVGEPSLAAGVVAVTVSS